MQDPISLLKGYPACEYLLVIQPSTDLCEKINGIKKAFAEKYELPVYQYANPNITLVKFQQYEMMEERIIRYLTTVATTNACFKIELDGFGSHPSHTIFINLSTQNQITNLTRELKRGQKLLKLDKDHKPHFITGPVISVASKLLPWQYEKGWLEYSHATFKGLFIAEQLVLLKRQPGEKKYKLAKDFLLAKQQLPTIKERYKSAQLSLF